jgi:hypothetical protein
LANKLWFDTPASEYMCGVPIGNGRLAAMILGGIGSPLDHRSPFLCPP